MPYDIHNSCACGKNDITPYCTAAGNFSSLCFSFSVKWVKSGHVTKLLFQLGGNPARHVGVFDFPFMTAPLQEKISADAPNCSWHGVGLAECCLEVLGCLTRTVDRQRQNRKKKKSRRTHTDESMSSFTHLCITIMHKPSYTHRHTVVDTHTTILVLCTCVCHAGGCWSWLTAVRAALVPVSGYFAKRAYYLQRWSPVEGPDIAPGRRFGSAAMRLVLNWGDSYRPPPGILPPAQRPPEGCW